MKNAIILVTKSIWRNQSTCNWNSNWRHLVKNFSKISFLMSLWVVASQIILFHNNFATQVTLVLPSNDFLNRGFSSIFASLKTLTHRSHWLLCPFLWVFLLWLPKSSWFMNHFVTNDAIIHFLWVFGLWLLNHLCSTNTSTNRSHWYVLPARIF